MHADSEQLVQLLIETQKTENDIRNISRSTANIYTTIMISILGGVILFADSKLNGIVHHMGFILGGLIVGAISLVAYFHFKSDFRRQVEMMVVQAKLEDILGFSDSKEYPLKKYWKNEPLIPLSYLHTRMKSKSSNEFVIEIMKMSDLRVIRLFYFVFFLSGLAMLVYGVALFW